MLDKNHLEPVLPMLTEFPARLLVGHVACGGNKLLGALAILGIVGAHGILHGSMAASILSASERLTL